MSAASHVVCLLAVSEDWTVRVVPIRRLLCAPRTRSSTTCCTGSQQQVRCVSGTSYPSDANPSCNELRDILS